MSLRHMTAGLLVILLLCGTGLAGACALRCGLAGACGHAVAGEAMAMSSAQCGEMNAAGEQADSVAGCAMICDRASSPAVMAGESGMLRFGVSELAVLSLVWPFGVSQCVGRHGAETPPRSICGSPGNLISIRV